MKTGDGGITGTPFMGAPFMGVLPRLTHMAIQRSLAPYPASLAGCLLEGIVSLTRRPSLIPPDSSSSRAHCCLTSCPLATGTPRLLPARHLPRHLRRVFYPATCQTKPCHNM